MEIELLSTVGQIGGVGGLALGIFLLLFRDLIRRSIFKNMPPDKTAQLLKQMALLVWSVAVIGLGVYAWTQTMTHRDPPPITVHKGVGAGGSISGSEIIIKSSTTGNKESAPDGIRVERGVGAGGDIKDSHIEITVEE